MKLLTVGTVAKLHRYLEINPNSTWYSVVFCTTEWVVHENFTIPCTYSNKYNQDNDMIFYTLLYNASLADNGWLKSL